MRGKIIQYAGVLALIAASQDAWAMSSAGRAECTVTGGKSLPADSGGKDALCRAIKRAVAAKAPGVGFKVDVRVLSKSTLAAVGDDPALLKKVLTYHVVKGKAPASTVVTLNGKSVKTLEGQGVRVTVRGGKVFLNGSTQVTKTDVMASNGVIHVINRVLIPKG